MTVTILQVCLRMVVRDIQYVATRHPNGVAKEQHIFLPKESMFITSLYCQVSVIRAAHKGRKYWNPPKAMVLARFFEKSTAKN